MPKLPGQQPDPSNVGELLAEQDAEVKAAQAAANLPNDGLAPDVPIPPPQPPAKPQAPSQPGESGAGAAAGTAGAAAMLGSVGAPVAIAAAGYATYSAVTQAAAGPKSGISDYLIGSGGARQSDDAGTAAMLSAFQRMAGFRSRM